MDAILRELRVTNQCGRDVVVHEAGGQTVGAGQSVTFTEGVDMSGDRISLMYPGGVYINDNIAVLELNGMFHGGIGVQGPRRNLNFIAQWGFMDLALDVALWGDSARSSLVCRDGRAKCSFSAQDCEHSTPDGSGVYEEHGPSGGEWGFCRSVHGSNLSDPKACTSDYASYVSDQCQVFDRSTASWHSQGRSVGYSNYGFIEGRFADGQTFPSTLTGRRDDLPAVTFECWEAPCILESEKAMCVAEGQTTVGNSGFATDCDEVDNLVDVAVMEIIACPSGPPMTLSTTNTETITTASGFLKPSPTADSAARSSRFMQPLLSSAPLLLVVCSLLSSGMSSM